MKHVMVRELEFPGNDEEGRAALHAYLASELGFPSHYGANLDALNDCLEDLREPVEITVVRASEDAFLCYEDLIAGNDGEWGWFDRLCRCLERATCDNDGLEISFTHEPANGRSLPPFAAGGHVLGDI